MLARSFFAFAPPAPKIRPQNYGILQNDIIFTNALFFPRSVCYTI